ncbi:MAG: YraN family protein [Emcibacter sp.]|nr:YraN family protein [Emcibacter sp.]
MIDKALRKKKKAYLWGQGAEWLSMALLTLKGYRILAQRFKCKSGEIDLIAKKGNLICFIEVKARSSRQAALNAVSYKQQQRIIKAAQWYLASKVYGKNDNAEDFCYRFDLMAVEPWGLPTHVKDAWQMEIKN